MPVLFGLGLIAAGVGATFSQGEEDALREHGQRAIATLDELACSTSTSVGRNSRSSTECSVHVAFELPSGEPFAARVGISHDRAYCRTEPIYDEGHRAPVYFDPAHPEDLVFDVSPCEIHGPRWIQLVKFGVPGLLVIGLGVGLGVLRRRDRMRARRPDG
jgi:hypothetical protein